jgi:glycosyltransferase involved in cell wall biosynthesis
MYNISVIIPTFNRANFISRAIKSVLNQTYQAKQIIVIDDGSDDETAEVLRQFDNIEVYHQSNSGVSSARNLGIQKAKYKWIAFLDSDDEWKNDKLEKQINFHKNNQKALISYTDETWIFNDKIVSKGKSNKKYKTDIFKNSIKKCFIGCSTVMIYKSVFEDIGNFDLSMKVCEDYDLWLRISGKYNIYLIEEELINKYAGHNNQLSFLFKAMDTFRIEALYKHINSKYHDIVINEINNRLNILENGAKKRNNNKILKFVEDKRKLYCGIL